MLKTISCGDLRAKHSGQAVKLAGWVDRRRDHGNLIFIDLRDRSGMVQIVFDPATTAATHEEAQQLRSEWVIQVNGNVRHRPEDTTNSKLETGEVEVLATDLTILNPSKTPPFYINGESEVDELLRMKYRYLDLRRPRMKNILALRHRVVKFIRDFLDNRGFYEVETPILIKSTPEGARDYVVPSRLHPGLFYGLPQSPQQLKQLLMAGGLEKYFQIARCFRDEDPRADRLAGEHTQLDLEMSFVEQEDILILIEELYTELVETLAPEKTLIKPFPRLTYSEAIDKYGTDKPDLRFGLEMSDLSQIAQNTNFRVFRDAIEAGGTVKGFSAPGCATYPRRKLDGLVEFVKQKGAQGLVWIALDSNDSIDNLVENQIKSPAAKFLSLDVIKSMAKAVGAECGDLILIIAGPDKSTNFALSGLRNEIGRNLELANPKILHFAFVVDFPLFEWDEDNKCWDATHHAFTMPKQGFEHYLDTAPEKVIAYCYDLVCNGIECASGSIRIHDRDLQEKIFKILGYTESQIEERFGHLLQAFQYGTPPHGGIAPGIERLLMVMTGIENIRDVIAFPKTQTGVDPLFQAPSPLDEDQLKEVHIRPTDV